MAKIGRPTTYAEPMQTVPVPMPRDMIDALRRAKESRGLSRSEIVRRGTARELELEPAPNTSRLRPGDEVLVYASDLDDSRTEPAAVEAVRANGVLALEGGRVVVPGEYRLP